MSFLWKRAIVLLAFLFGTITASWDTCEKIDGDCPDDCAAAGFNGTLGFVARLNISPTHPAIQAVAKRAEKYIVSQGAVHVSCYHPRFAAAPASSTDLKLFLSVVMLQSTDDPNFGLHTSLFYFCCHTADEYTGIKRALHDMQWKAFHVHYDSFACNLDHNNDTIYLHGLPTNQTALFDLAHNIESTVESAGFPINHPRKSMFHMTLARVNHSYPVDDVVNYFLDNASSWDFGTLVLHEFTIDGEIYHASSRSS